MSLWAVAALPGVLQQCHLEHMAFRRQNGCVCDIHLFLIQCVHIFLLSMNYALLRFISLCKHLTYFMFFLDHF